MRITNINVAYYNPGSFMVGVGESETMINVTMTEEESAQVRSLVTEMFLTRQAAIAKEIRDAKPIMLADFREVQPPPVDDLPF